MRTRPQDEWNAMEEELAELKELRKEISDKIHLISVKLRQHKQYKTYHQQNPIDKTNTFVYQMFGKTSLKDLTPEEYRIYYNSRQRINRHKMAEEDKALKWTCTIIQRDRKYRAVMLIDNREVDGIASDVSYRILAESIRQTTAIVLPKRKDMIFERLSDFEMVATIDATQQRIDNRVTLAERKNGWQPCWD